MPVEFYNDSAFIRVVDTSTRVESFFNKEGLVIQAMTDQANPSFFLRSDSYHGYYSFQDVSVPAKANLTALVSQLGAWAFDKLYTSSFDNEPHSLLQLRVVYDKSPLYIDEARNDVVPYPSGTGSVAGSLDSAVASAHLPSSREVLMESPIDSGGSGEGGRIVRQSKMYASCPADKYMVAMVSGTLLDPDTIGGADYVAVSGDPVAMSPSIGCTYRIGVFDDEGDISAGFGAGSGNGIFVEYGYNPSRTDHLAGDSNENHYAVEKLAGLVGSDASTFVAKYLETKLWVVLRTSISGEVADSRVPRFDWVDPLSAAEGSILELDPTRTHSYIFRWSAASGTKVSVGTMHFGVVNWMHYFDNTGADAYRLGSSTLPVRWELDNRQGQARAKMRQGRAAISCDGSYDVPGRPFSFDTHLSQVSLSTPTPTPIISVRLQASRARGRLHPQKLTIANRDSGSILKYELRLNASLTGATFAKSESYSFDTQSGVGTSSLGDFGSFAEVDTAATSVSGGLTVASGYVTDVAFRDIALDFREIQLVSDISGRPDSLTVVCTFMQGVSTVSAGLAWMEYD